MFSVYKLLFTNSIYLYMYEHICVQDDLGYEKNKLFHKYILNR